jgi:hypothetical protein
MYSEPTITYRQSQLRQRFQGGGRIGLNPEFIVKDHLAQAVLAESVDS